MINKRSENNLSNESFSEAEIFPLLYSIINTKLDTMSKVENFLQLIVNVGAKIVGARNSSLVIFTDNIDLLIPEAKKTSRREGHSFRNVYKSESHITIPLILREMKDPFGYLRVEEKLDNRKFDSHDLFLLLLLARQATLKIENELLYKQVHRDLTKSFGVIVNILESKNKYTYFHSQKVTQLALSIAEQLSLEAKDKEALRLAGILHDIGKIGIPDTILSKKDELSLDEVELVKTHPSIGEDIIKPLEFLGFERSIIRHHHERLDGSGYPDGLTQDDIPLCTRIIAVADSFEAMTSNRPYRKAKSSVDSLKELEYLADKKYDKEVVWGLKKTLAAN